MMTLFEFGKAIVEAKDLDPHYKLFEDYYRFDPSKAKNLVFAFACYSHLGTAAKITEFSTFKEGLKSAIDDKLPTGRARMYFRDKSKQNILQYMENITPMQCFDFFEDKPLDFISVKKRVERIPSFGAVASWKIADIMECCFDTPVSFSNAYSFIHKSPLQGIALHCYNNKERYVSFDTLLAVFKQMQGILGHLNAPTTTGRQLNIQEFETILCEYKKYRIKSTYQIGEVREKYIKQLEEVQSPLGKKMDMFLGRGA